MGTEGTLATSSAGALVSAMPSASTFSGLITVELNRSNFPLWRAQVVPAISGADLFGYLDGTIVAPPSSLTEGEDKDKRQVSNPAYAVWYRQDQVVLAALLSHMHLDILAQMTTYTTSRQVWTALHAMFSAQNQAAINTIRFQLSGLKKNDLSVVEYYQKMKSLADSMAVAGRPLADDEIIGYISAGLGEEFDGLMGSLTVLGRPVTLAEFYSFLLSYEARQTLRQNQASDFHSSANNVNRTNVSSNNSRGSGSAGGNSSRPPAPQGGGQGGGYRGGRDGGRGRGRYNNGWPALASQVPSLRQARTCRTEVS
jgi:hypothetical protein